MVGCSVDGQLNQEKFSEPIPWIGLYVAAASLACAIAMGMDVLRGFSQKKLWFPSKCFSINATSLTIITVATKLSVDLNTAMPSRTDQLAKLSSGALICTVMGNSMPSLGSMDNSDLFTNMMALGILVVTAIVNIGIQLGTGVIYLYRVEHAFIMVLMLILLVILSFSAITVPTTKKYFEYKYNKRYRMAQIDCSSQTVCKADEKLKQDLTKYWMMAHTSSPQFVVGRSATCTASGAICLVSAMAFAEAMLRSYLMPQSIRFCTGESDYKWSTILILIAQTIAVGVGTIAPAIRWFTAVNFRGPKTKEKIGDPHFFKVERYWTKLLIEMKDSSFTMHIQNRHCRRLAHETKNKMLDLCIALQTGVVLGCKVIRYISVFFVSQILILSRSCKKLKLFRSKNSITVDPASEAQPVRTLDLSRFVLHLEGEEVLVQLMMKSNFDATDHWLRSGKRKEPKRLAELLEKSNYFVGYRGVKEFDCDRVPSLTYEEPPNCWAFPVVTLTAIAVALPDVSDFLAKKIIDTVHESLRFVKIVEEKLETSKDLKNIQNAAYAVWLQLDLYQKWLDVDLRELSLPAKSSKEVLEVLSEAAKERFLKFKSSCVDRYVIDNPVNKWPVKVLAAYSMYRISQTMLLQQVNVNHPSGITLFEAIKVIISDILGACFTNLQPVLHRSVSTNVEEREESIRHAVYLLGKTQKIINLADRKSFTGLGLDQIANIDEWRSFHKRNYLFSSSSSLEMNDKDSASSPDLYITLE